MIRQIKKFLIRYIYRGRIDFLFEDVLKMYGVGVFGDLETTGEDLVLKILSKKMNNEGKLTIFDVGANVGDYSIELLKYFNNSKIYSFEPNPLAFRRLSKINSNNIIKENLALGSRVYKAKLYSFSKLENTQLSSLNNDCVKGLYEKELKDKIVSYPVKATTLDKYCNDNEIKIIDFLKVDVEGFELEVFKGAKKLINSNSVKYIQFEFNIHNIVNKIFLKDFYELLKQYKLYRISASGLIDISKYDTINELFKYQNILAVRNDMTV